MSKGRLSLWIRRVWRFVQRHFIASLLILFACYWVIGSVRQRLNRQPLSPRPDFTLVTGYCNCGKCCGWQRSWLGFGEPVYNYGSLKGRPKKVGVTASGAKARLGTIAADPKVFPFGTHLYIPGYGLGTVEDVGGSIRGRHIDIWFPTHAQARAWGARWLKVSPTSR